MHEAGVGLVVQTGHLGRPAAGRLMPREDDQALQSTVLMMSAQAGQLSAARCDFTRYMRCCFAWMSTARAQAGHVSLAKLLLQGDHKAQAMVDTAQWPSVLYKLRPLKVHEMLHDRRRTCQHANSRVRRGSKIWHESEHAAVLEQWPLQHGGNSVERAA